MRLGITISDLGPPAFERAAALGASALSVPIRPGQDQKRLLRAAHTDHNLAILGVLDRVSFRARLDWRASAESDLDWAMDLVEAGLLDAIAIGHEPDDGFRDGRPDDPLVVPRGGVGSWAMSLAELAELITLMRTRMREVPFPVPLVLGGLCSWRPEVVGRLDLALLDGILIHPYGLPEDPEVTLGVYLDALAATLHERGLQGRVRLGIGELGQSDQVHRRGQIADWFGRALAYLAGRGDVDCCFVCCDSDRTLDGYGQFDARDRPKPSVATIFDVAVRLPTEAPLVQVSRETPEPEPTSGPEDEPAWDDPCFTPEQVTEALIQVELSDSARTHLGEVIRRLWPLFGPSLAQIGIPEDPAARAALLAALYVGTAGRLAPTVEGGSYTRAEHRYLGVLGNQYHGDGWRYRGRGLLRIRGRDLYAHYEQVTGLPLLDEPDLLTESSIAAVVAALRFSELGLFDAAIRGDWVGVWRGVDPSLNGYGTFLAVVQALLLTIDATSEPDENVLGPAALGKALTRVGDPYIPGGDRPGGFDGPGLVTWAYAQVREGPLPMTLDAMVEATQPVPSSRTQPGDLVFYQYGDPASGGSRYDHVGLLVDEALVLDCRAEAGVSYRPHVRGALRRYRRVTGVSLVAEEEGDEAMWRKQYEAVVAVAQELTDSVVSIRQRLEDRPEPPRQPIDKAPKREWVAYGERVRRHQERVDALINDQAFILSGVETKLRWLAKGGSGGETEP